MLSLVMIGVPLVGSALTLLLKIHSGRGESQIPVISSCIVLAAGVVVFFSLGNDGVPQVLLSGLGLPWGLGLRADLLGVVLACLAALLWLAASLSALDYMKDDPRQATYHAFFLLTLSGVTGTFLAADLISLLLFFEIMTLASYVLVVHNRDGEAVSAGSIYLYLSLAGSMVVVMGAALLQSLTGSLSLSQSAVGGSGAELAVILMVLGFSVKAGMIPLHIWLPRAHPVAPAPASAVLSGIMIKTGAYGMIRVLLLVDGYPIARQVGLALVIMAAVTMIGGVSMALLQGNAKRMLAYHSVSQMGYILMGVGLIGYLGLEDPVGLAGSLYHMVNHALFKSALFLVAGAVYMKTHQLDMYKLGGLWRHMPYTALLGFIAAMGIAGIPGLNGYASKTVLHHSLHHALYADPALILVEWAFTITGAGTACSFMKFFSYIFLGKPRSDYSVSQGEPMWTVLGTSLPTLLIVYLGVRPWAFLTRIAEPALGHLGKPASLAEISIFGPKDLQGIAISLVLGTLLFLLGTRWGLFHIHLPSWFSVQWLAGNGAGSLSRSWSRVLGGLESASRQGAGSLDGLASAGLSVLRQMDSQGPTPYRRYQPSVANLSFDAALVVAVLALILIARAALHLW